MMLSLHLCVRSFRRGTGQTIASAPKGPSKLVLSKRGPCTGRPNGRDPDPCNVFSTSGGAWCSLDKHRRRSESRAIKLRKHSTYRQVAEAEQAAANKDQRGLYSVIRRLKSKGRQRASRLQNQDFTPMTPEQEMQAVLQYSRSTFSCLPDAQVPAPLLEGLSLSNAEYAAQLKGLGLRKAVPEHVAPTAVWRLCAHEISAILGPALREHFGEFRRGLDSGLHLMASEAGQTAGEGRGYAANWPYVPIKQSPCRCASPKVGWHASTAAEVATPVCLHKRARYHARPHQGAPSFSDCL